MRIIKSINDLPQEKQKHLKEQEKEAKIRREMNKVLREMAIERLKAKREL
jgi:hypothetical protein